MTHQVDNDAYRTAGSQSSESGCCGCIVLILAVLGAWSVYQMVLDKFF